MTDNASNMLSMVDKMNADQMKNKKTLKLYVRNSGMNDDLLDKISEEVSLSFQINHMHCAVHTQQLTIRDSLKGEYASNLISEVRHLATAARKPKVDEILRRRTVKGAIIDQATR